MPGHLIRRAHQASTALFAAECGPHDLTPVQFAAMAAIARTPDLDATRLAAAIAFDRSTMGDVLERLEAKGWVAREPSATDRRVKKLALTEAGAALLERVEGPVARVQEQLLAPFAPEEHARVMDVLWRLSEAAG
jgi:MarR family transcriptional regulator, lower aerobic nicotinate degradation pathway regulator